MNKQKKRLLWIGLAVLLSILLYWRSDTYKEGFQSAAIPNVIWTYWNQDTIPPIVQKCIESWRKQNPDFKVNVVFRSTLHEYLPNLQLDTLSWNDSPARESDIVRLNLLAQYGGYWCDASTLMTDPLDFNVLPQTQFIGYWLEGFTTNIKYPVIESWFFATVPGGTFITAWRDAFMGLSDCESVDVCIERAMLSGVDLQNISKSLRNYLYIHVAAQYALQKVMAENEIKSTMAFFKAEDGPYKYLVDAKWDPKTAAESICADRSKKIYKLRSHERKEIENSETLLECFLHI